MATSLQLPGRQCCHRFGIFPFGLTTCVDLSISTDFRFLHDSCTWIVNRLPCVNDIVMLAIFQVAFWSHRFPSIHQLDHHQARVHKLLQKSGVPTHYCPASLLAASVGPPIFLLFFCRGSLQQSRLDAVIRRHARYAPIVYGQLCMVKCCLRHSDIVHHFLSLFLSRSLAGVHATLVLLLR